MFTCFDRRYERDRQTDRQTHTHTVGHRMTAKAALDASIARKKTIQRSQLKDRLATSEVITGRAILREGRISCRHGLMPHLLILYA